MRPAEWFETCAVAGVEGLVVKGGAHRYPGGKRVWVKVNHRRLLDVVCAAVIGSARSLLEAGGFRPRLHPHIG